MQDSNWKYTFPPKKGEPYPKGCEMFHHKFSGSWKPPVDPNILSDGSFLRDCWFMRVPLIKWVVGTDNNKNTYWVYYDNDDSLKFKIQQVIKENKIVFLTCKGEFFDTLDEAKASYEV